MPLQVPDEEFDACVEAALDAIPGDIAGLVENCVVLVEDASPPDEPDLFGYYEGTPLTQRGTDYAGVLPDRIMIFRRPHLEECDSLDQLVNEIRVTVVHEIAHHFGIDDARLHDLGYG